MENKKVITRFAPSPTGLLHLGNYRTAVFSYLFARKHHGKFVLRIEDTDKERSKKEYEDNILESLRWLGLECDEFYRQSERIDSHKKYLNKLIDEGKAYISKEEAKDGSGIIKEIVRFKNPNKQVSFHDLIRGTITFDTTELGDFVIARNINEPLFHMAVVVDDFESGITHVIRGEDHISNTPRHILIQEAIGAPTPEYAHLPLVLSEDRSKLSKRKGALPLTEYMNQGYIPEAMLNGMALIGWNPGTEQEIFNRDELIEFFELSKVGKSGAIFNPIKLDWINKEHLRLIPDNEKLGTIQLELEKAGLPLMTGDFLERISPVIIERINKWSDIGEMVRAGDLDYFFKEPIYVKEEMVWKKLKDNPDGLGITKQYLGEIVKLLSEIPEDSFSFENIKESIMKLAEVKGNGDVLWPMRFSLSGKEKSPDPFTIAFILGKEKTIKRLDEASK